jgi:hypothetical protein
MIKNITLNRTKLWTTDRTGNIFLTRFCKYLYKGINKQKENTMSIFHSKFVSNVKLIIFKYTSDF